MDIGNQDPRDELVRPPPLARRQRASHIAIEAILVTTSRGVQVGPSAGGQQQLIADLCQQPQSLAEIAAHMGVPLGVARKLVADMATEQLLTLHLPTDNDRSADRAESLERVLDGLRNL
jgi:Protein of unknown function (DUF742)